MSPNIPYGDAAESKVEELEDQFDAALAKLARAEQTNEETVPFEVLQRLADGAVPVIVWREHRGLSQEQLAAAARVQVKILAEVESGREDVPLRAMYAIARTLRIDLDDLVPWSMDGDDAVEVAQSC